MRTSERLLISRLLGLVAAFATIVVTPWFSLDPINVSKLAVISVGGFMALVFIGFNWKMFTTNEFRIPMIIGIAWLVHLTLVLIFAGNNFEQEFFGANGRATGYVAYVALAGLLLVGVVSASRSSLTTLSWAMLASGLLSTVYGVFQAQGLDPIKWVNQYSPVIGFLGNPNFESSFVALSAVMAVAMLFNNQSRLMLKTCLTLYIAVAIYVIKETKSQQGYLVFLGGSAVIIMILVYKSKAKMLILPVLAGGFSGLVLAVMGSLNIGPLASVLHKESVIYRGDYWRAGWKMTIEHPIFGIGLDSYGDWYRRTRTIEATLRRGPEVTSNSAHNVLLDLSSNGGFPLLIIYLALMGLVLRAAFRVIKRSPNFDPVFTGLFAVWLAFQAQSIISLNQLGLAVWGWIISGLIIGYEINSRSVVSEIILRQPAKRNRSYGSAANQGVLPKTLLALFIGLLIGLLAGLPPLIASTKYKSALESNNKTIVKNAISIFPQDSSRTLQIADIFYQNKLEAEALGIVSTAVKRYPDSFEAWGVMALLSKSSPVRLAEAEEHMKRLDPHNPNLK